MPVTMPGGDRRDDACSGSGDELTSPGETSSITVDDLDRPGENTQVMTLL